MYMYIHKLIYVYIYTYIICCLLYENEKEERMYVYDTNLLKVFGT